MAVAHMLRTQLVVSCLMCLTVPHRYGTVKLRQQPLTGLPSRMITALYIIGAALGAMLFALIAALCVIASHDPTEYQD